MEVVLVQDKMGVALVQDKMEVVLVQGMMEVVLDQDMMEEVVTRDMMMVDDCNVPHRQLQSSLTHRNDPSYLVVTRRSYFEGDICQRQSLLVACNDRYRFHMMVDSLMLVEVEKL